MVFGERLRSERKRVGLTQGDLADRASVESQTQSLYETNKRRPKADYLAAIAEVGLDVNFVLTGNRAVGDIAADEADLLDSFRSLESEDRTALVRVARAMTGKRPSSSTLHEERIEYVSEGAVP